MLDYETLKIIWWLILSIVLIAFAITGGLDIGVNILLPVVGQRDEDRRMILNTIGPTWEGNQVWLITFGAGLFAIWPNAYAASFSSLYTALMIALFMLILRPPGFDYRSKLKQRWWRNTWDLLLFVGSIVLALILGVAIGNLFVGIPFNFDSDMRPIFTGDLFDLLSPMALMFGVTSLLMCALQGGLFLQYKLEGILQQRAKDAVKYLAIAFIAVFVYCGIYAALWVMGYQITSIPNLNTGFAPIEKIVQRVPSGWLNNYTDHEYLWAVPIIALIATRVALRFSQLNRPLSALFINSIGVACTVLTAGISIFPFVLPSITNPNHSLTIWDACSSKLTLQWGLVAVILLLPFVLLYTFWVYRVMRGKVKLNIDSY